jgi:CRP-like cAMP-binding protein
MSGLAHLQSRISHVPHLAAADVGGFRAFASNSQVFQKGQALIRTSMPYSNAYLINSGWAVSYRMLSDGRRQIINFLIPGDFVCLGAAVTATSDCFVDATTTLSAMTLPRSSLKDMFRMSNGVGDIALYCIGREASIITEHLTSVGQRTAHERLIHILLELWIRLGQAGLCSGRDFALPTLHRDIADALALSDVHLSRTVKAIRDRGLFVADFLRRHITILDLDKAIRESAFDAGYLWSDALLC